MRRVEKYPYFLRHVWVRQRFLNHKERDGKSTRSTSFSSASTSRQWPSYTFSLHFLGRPPDAPPNARSSSGVRCAPHPRARCTHPPRSIPAVVQKLPFPIEKNLLRLGRCSILPKSVLNPICCIQWLIASSGAAPGPRRATRWTLRRDLVVAPL
ncbi:hypothetical protein BE221DRAFT_72753 [Ostreococcus tauri]|uniref:Uncharacterized protein n=1 Tax=Ostreococcus tauri TaxID=70448 RepID=A0A1Y5IBT6_OSTTA|nr:hypothetical protein BE221DRAFT_72753 [Ostreococcus tauri]